MNNNQLALSFKVYKNNENGVKEYLKTIELTQNVIKIGKGMKTDLKLDDESVGIMHSYIQINEKNEVFISDVVSNQGTIINGEKIQKKQLNSNDEILLGNSLLIVNFQR
jgi:predicted component of type VI protein secretion system